MCPLLCMTTMGASKAAASRMPCSLTLLWWWWCWWSWVGERWVQTQVQTPADSQQSVSSNELGIAGPEQENPYPNAGMAAAATGSLF